MSATDAPAENVTYHEIITQTVAWREAIELIKRHASALQTLWAAGESFDEVVFTGCGSTYYLSIAAATLWQSMLDVPARAYPAGELYLYPQTAYGPSSGRRTLMVAVSRSGTTSETIAAVRQFQASHAGKVIVITNYGATPLGELGDVTIAIPAGQEESVAQTRSFASMYVATTALTALLAGEDTLLVEMEKLPAAGDALIAAAGEQASALGSNLTLDRIYFLGSGPRYGLACEVNLKMKEMTLTHSEPFHFFEFRHGPMSMVNENAAVIGLLSDSNRSAETQVLTEMAALGGRVFSLGERDADVAFHSGLPESVRNVLYLPALQLTAYYRAVAKGLNPDRPENLTAVVELDLEI